MADLPIETEILTRKYGKTLHFVTNFEFVNIWNLRDEFTKSSNFAAIFTCKVPAP